MNLNMFQASLKATDDHDSHDECGEDSENDSDESEVYILSYNFYGNLWKYTVGTF